MSVCLFGLDLYFAAMLGVSGLAKLADRAPFVAALSRQHAAWRLGRAGTRRLLPYLEVVVATCLVTGFAPIAAAATVVALFTGFFLVKTMLALRRSQGACGCYGSAYLERVDGASVIASFILMAVAAAHLWLATSVEPVGTIWRAPAAGLYAGAVCWLGWKVVTRHRAARQADRSTPVSADWPAPSGP